MSKAASKSKANHSNHSSLPDSNISHSNVLLIEVPPQFIALCEASGVSPQSTLRGMAAMLCGLRYDEQNRLLPLDDASRSSVT
jgi:hypothetical protein